MRDTEQWRPSAQIEQLRSRAKIMQQIRAFFAKRDVLEVETPIMSQAAVTDIHLQTFKTQFVGPGYAKPVDLYLMTSPEFHMKRLLAAGSGCIYQICQAFRNEEAGRFHNPEFAILEWYRVGFDLYQLMDEMDELLQMVLATPKGEMMTYQEAFINSLGICPLESSMSELKQLAVQLNLANIAEQEEDRDTLLELLFSVGVEPKIGQERPAFVYNFPASQAALAKINPEDSRVAERFEAYYKGIELSNGFHELADGPEQLIRFKQDNAKRAEMNLASQPIDMNFIAALDAGFPDCSGVALGLDRLIMLALQGETIADVMTFPVDRA